MAPILKMFSFVKHMELDVIELTLSNTLNKNKFWKILWLFLHENRFHVKKTKRPETYFEAYAIFPHTW